MNEVRKRQRYIKGTELTTWQTEIEEQNTLLAEAGTTGFTDDGAVTFVKIADVKNTDARVVINENGIAFVFTGNSELLTLMRALDSIVNTLDDQIKEAGIDLCSN
jgi:hypothetical protein